MRSISISPTTSTSGSRNAHTRVILLFIEASAAAVSWPPPATALAAGKSDHALKTGRSQKSRDRRTSLIPARSRRLTAPSLPCARYGIVNCPTPHDMVEMTSPFTSDVFPKGPRSAGYNVGRHRRSALRLSLRDGRHHCAVFRMAATKASDRPLVRRISRRRIRSTAGNPSGEAEIGRAVPRHCGGSSIDFGLGRTLPSGQRATRSPLSCVAWAIAPTSRDRFVRQNFSVRPGGRAFQNRSLPVSARSAENRSGARRAGLLRGRSG